MISYLVIHVNKLLLIRRDLFKIKLLQTHGLLDIISICIIYQCITGSYIYCTYAESRQSFFGFVYAVRNHIIGILTNIVGSFFLSCFKRTLLEWNVSVKRCYCNILFYACYLFLCDSIKIIIQTECVGAFLCVVSSLMLSKITSYRDSYKSSTLH